MPSHLIRRVLIFCALSTFGVACSSNDITFGSDLNVSILSNAPVSASDSLRLDYDITGRSLAGMVIAWGDSQIDSVGFLGAQTAGGSEYHVYDSAGTYMIQATVVDQIQGSDVTELTVTITP